MTKTMSHCGLPLPPSNVTTTASVAQAMTSEIAAHDRESSPKGVRISPWSERILAKTGKAVTDMAAPMNRTKPR